MRMIWNGVVEFSRTLRASLALDTVVMSKPHLLSFASMNSRFMG